VHPAGTTVQINATLRAGQKIFYTLDGSDPRPPFVPPTIDGTTLVSESAPARAWVPTSDVGAAWRTDLAFDDGAWLAGTNGVGYERSSGYGPYINIDTNTAMQSSTSCYVRVKFNVDATQLAGWNFLTLGVRYDDGFVAYLNGTQVMADRAPSPAAWNAAATQTHDDGAAVNFQNFDLSARLGTLRVGENLLAIHAMNESAGSSDFLNQVRLIAGRRDTPPGGGAGGIEYTGPIVLNKTARLVARVFDSSGGHDPNSGLTPVGTGWSAPLRAEYLINETPAAAGSLVISELMFDPHDFGGATERQEFEWIEVQNVSNGAISLTGVSFTEGIGFVFPLSSLAPGERGLVVKNRAAFEQVYGSARAAKVLGDFTGALDGLGESMVLTAADGTPIQSLTYAATDARRGHSIVFGSEGRRESRSLLGSPGTAEPSTVDVPNIVLNELLTNPPAPELARLEIFNPTSQDADLSGWFVTDDLGAPEKFRLPDDTVVRAGGFAVFTESDLSGWSRNVRGGGLYLVAATPGGERLDYVDGFIHGDSGVGVAYGRHVISTGEVAWVPMATPSLGEANGEPRAAPLIITELMYHPPAGGTEFLELQNIGTTPVPLSGTIIQGTGFSFASGSPVLPVGGLALVVAGDPTTFRTTHAVPEDVPVFGPMPAALANGGERLRVLMPEASAQAGDPPLLLPVDTVSYSDDPPWPASADGLGHSLHRALARFGSEPLHWTAQPPTPGVTGSSPQDWRAQFFTAEELANPALSGALADADGDGQPNHLEYLMGSHPRSATSTSRYDITLTAAGTIEVRFSLRDGVAGITTTLEQSPNLTDWQPASTFTLTSSQPNGNGTSTLTYTGPPPTTPHFYRIAIAGLVTPP
jgi:hypothetical protein